MDALGAKVASILILLALTLASSWAPVWLFHRGVLSASASPQRKLVLDLLNCFSGGVFLGTCLLNLLAEGQETFEDYCQQANFSSHFPLFLTVVAVGIFAVAFVEKLGFALMMRRPPISRQLSRGMSSHGEASHGLSSVRDDSFSSSQTVIYPHLTQVSGYGATLTTSTEERLAPSIQNSHSRDLSLSKSRREDGGRSCTYWQNRDLSFSKSRREDGTESYAYWQNRDLSLSKSRREDGTESYWQNKDSSLSKSRDGAQSFGYSKSPDQLSFTKGEVPWHTSQCSRKAHRSLGQMDRKPTTDNDDYFPSESNDERSKMVGSLILSGRDSASDPRTCRSLTNSLEAGMVPVDMVDVPLGGGEQMGLQHCQQRPHHHHNLMNSTSCDADLSQISLVRATVLLAALSFHTVFDGLAIGLQTDAATVWQLLAAISIHKTLVSFCLGLELSMAAPDRPKRPLLLTFLFSLVSPLGVAIGLGVTSGHLDSLAQLLVSSLLQALATGTFMYVTFFEILGQQFLHQHEDHVNHHDRSSQLLGVAKVGVVAIGFAVTALVKVLDNH